MTSKASFARRTVVGRSFSTGVHLISILYMCVCFLGCFEAEVFQAFLDQPEAAEEGIAVYQRLRKNESLLPAVG